jgi:uncharacterized DUF497 family protein
MEFEWDEAKAVTNLVKHGVSFTEAATAFTDSLAAIFTDPQHSEDEKREILVGYSEYSQLLIVSDTQRDDAVRIISARKAGRGERQRHTNHTNRGNP